MDWTSLLSSFGGGGGGGKGGGSKEFGRSSAETNIYGRDSNSGQATPKWLLPVVIGGAALVVVFVLILSLAKK